MAETLNGKKIKALPETTVLNDTDDFIVEDATPKTKRAKMSTIYNAVKSKLAAWTFSLNTSDKTLPGAVNELKAGFDTQNSNLVNLSEKVKSANIVLTYSSSTMLRGYCLFDKNIVSAVACVQDAAGTPVNGINNLCVDVGFGGTGNRVEVYANGNGFVSGHVLKVNIIAISQ